ncbi:hypothetical protein C1I95_24645 [Micromonospora craterilacus]|uniref:Uncharacterized protein n=1 Tax=Micromonospora craterilacus TaxID=1655439 RepID=A0A2W2E8G6_9ACTN|nr:hypothetical protein [Micromonospora craterilacus]PZG12999.1 hypothetical protein C1I95_24645 [Micromonospora craterilacus]
MPSTADNFTTGPDRWGYLKGARFVQPAEWDQYAQDVVGRQNIHMWPIVDALSLAANNDGLIRNFEPDEFYTGPLSDAMRNEDDEASWQLVYDRFSAVVLMKLMFKLVEAGLLATRGNGDSSDYRLTLPATERPSA